MVGGHGSLYVVAESSDDDRPSITYDMMHLKHGTNFKDIVSDDIERLQATASQQGFEDKPYFAGDDNEWAGDILQLGGVFLLGPGRV